MKGSMTIEAVFVMSLLLLIIMWIMSASIDLYLETVETAGITWIEANEAAEAFRRNFFLRQLMQ